jgi:hypothetical protein
MAHLFKAIAFFVLLALFVGCGYKPSSQYSRESIGQSVSTSVEISAMDPENTVIIKDAVDSAIIEVFRTSLTTQDKSDTHLTLSMSNPSYAPIQFNSNGYVVAYRMTLNLRIKKTHNAISKDYSARGTYDFTVEPNAVVTDQQRFDAIRLSAVKAIASFVAQIAAEGARSNYNSAQKAE